VSRSFLIFVFLCVSCLVSSGEEATTRGPNLKPPPPLDPEILERAPKELPPNLPEPEEMMEKLRQLDELLRMSPQALRKLRRSIEAIEEMSPRERQAMQLRLAKITRMTPQLKDEIESLARLLPGSYKEPLTQYWLSLEPEGREKLRLRWKDLERNTQAVDLLRQVDLFIERRDRILASPENGPPE